MKTKTQVRAGVGPVVAVDLICTEAAEVIAEPHPLAAPLRELAGAARELIPEAAAALRAQASQLAACPAL